MTMTQVSTWFANARRRLKKENKWNPESSFGTTDCEESTTNKCEESGYSSQNDGSNSSEHSLHFDSTSRSRSPPTLENYPTFIPSQPGWESGDKIKTESFKESDEKPKAKIWSLVEMTSDKDEQESDEETLEVS